MLELQVALVVLGIALSGLLPLLVMQSRVQRGLDARMAPNQTQYLGPTHDAWARKLGAKAALSLSPTLAAPAAPTLDADDSSALYSEAGTAWTAAADAGAYGGSCRKRAGGSASDVASFSFTGLRPGWYEVFATWPAGAAHAGFAPFIAWDGAAKRGTYLVSQVAAPVGNLNGGRPWAKLGNAAVAGTSLRVDLAAQVDPSLVGSTWPGLGAVASLTADVQVVADGVRLVPLRNAVSVTSLTKELAGEAVAARVAVTVVTP